jgi:AcrR family transcriptional regulator
MNVHSNIGETMSKPEKRDDIVKASLELFAEQGFHGAPMAMIAQRAGVGAGTIYRYFENRDVLITELFRELEERSYPVIQHGYEANKPLRERYLHLCTALLHYFIDNPTDFRFLEQFFNSPYGVACRRDKLTGVKGRCDVFHELFEDGISQQVMKELPFVVLSDLTFGPLLALARDHILGFIVLDESLVCAAIEACWDGVRR